MTTKTKAHGFCNKKELIKFVDLKEWALIDVNLFSTNLYTEPTCLISPSTCDKVREFVEAMRKRDLNQSEIYYAAELLKLLPEVE